MFKINEKGIIIPDAQKLGIKTTEPNPDYDLANHNVNLKGDGVDFYRALQKIESGPLAKILVSPCLPLVLPAVSYADYGTAFSRKFLPEAKAAYERNHDGKVLQVVPPTDYLENNFHAVGRHKDWFKRSHLSASTFLYFPYALLGVSPSGARVLEEHLPPGFSLAGPITNASALVCYSDFLLNQQWVVDGAGAYWFTEGESVYFQRQRWGAIFYTGLDSQDENFSPALVYEVEL